MGTQSFFYANMSSNSPGDVLLTDKQGYWLLQFLCFLESISFGIRSTLF